MHGYVFKSRGGALFFVVLTLFGVASLVGTEETDGAIAGATSQFERNRGVPQPESLPQQEAEPQPDPFALEPDMTEEPVDIEFTPAEDLVQDPTGFDPTPILPDPTAAEIISVEPETAE